MRPARRVAMTTLALSGLLLTGALAPALAASSAGGAAGAASSSVSTTGLKPGQVKHVWLIILENKSYDSTFTGLNKNSYLWKTLPSQGVLLKNYYGTGHYSMDNYLSLVSGQAPARGRAVGLRRRQHQPGQRRHHRQAAQRATPSAAATTTARSRRRPVPTRPTGRTGAPTRSRPRRCSTSSTRPMSPGRGTPRTCTTSRAARMRSGVARGPGRTTRPRTRGP